MWDAEAVNPGRFRNDGTYFEANVRSTCVSNGYLAYLAHCLRAKTLSKLNLHF